MKLLSDFEASAHSTSSGLLSDVRRENPAAWNQFADLYAPLIYRWARMTAIQPADAEDVTQEVFRVIARRLPDYRRTASQTSLRAWMWGITRNVILQHFEKLHRVTLPPGGSTAQHRLNEIPDVLHCNEPPRDPDADKSLLMRVLRLIRNDFEESTWQAFWRTTVENQSATEVGRDLAMAAGAVRQAKCRVLARLREEFPRLNG